jgi:Leucine-rich repeat (LRR) protein
MFDDDYINSLDKNTKILDLTDINISNYSLLSRFEYLTTLYLKNSNIMDISFLSDLTQLKNLSLHNIKIV